MHTRERAMSIQERKFLQRMLEGPTGLFGHLRLAVNVGVAGWFISMALIVLCWSIVAWVLWAVTGAEIGPRSPVAGQVFPMSWTASAVIAVLAAVIWVTRRRSECPELLADLREGRVIEEDYEFTAAKRMRSPEHGALMYFLRTREGPVMVLYEDQGKDIAVFGADPKASRVDPSARLTMVRAPHTGHVIAMTFSGVPLDPGELLEIAASQYDWPEDEEFCDVPWEDLENIYCR